MIFGCNYFTYKYERDENGLELYPSKLSGLFTAMREDNKIMIMCCVSGDLLCFIMIALSKTVNIKGDDVSPGGNLLYLLFSRSLYSFGFSLAIMPLIL